MSPQQRSTNAGTARTDTDSVCTLADLTAPNAQALQELLRSAVLLSAPLRFEETRDVDLAAVQLLLAFFRQRVGKGQKAFQEPLPELLLKAFELAGCLNELGEIDTESVI